MTLIGVRDGVVQLARDTRALVEDREPSAGVALAGQSAARAPELFALAPVGGDRPTGKPRDREDRDRQQHVCGVGAGDARRSPPARRVRGCRGRCRRADRLARPPSTW
jgi:hypothetical protein